MISNYENVDDNNFFVSWSDLVSLLLVFFVYLYSISEIDPLKFLQVKYALSGSEISSVEEDVLEILKLEQESLKTIYIEMEAFIQEESLQEVVSVTLLEDRLEISLGNVLLFEQGEATLKKNAEVILYQVGGLFNKNDGQIVVEGHTDDVPIETNAFPSNWELSSARASSVVRFLRQVGVQENRFVVMAFNQFKPVVPNTDDVSRAKNRRVKITVRPDRAKLIARQQGVTNG